MAAPHVTGAAALLHSRKPKLSPAAVKQHLQKTARLLKGATRNDQGSGLLQAVKAVESNFHKNTH